MFMNDPSAKPQRRAAEPRSFVSWTERAALHAASLGGSGLAQSRAAHAASAPTPAPRSEATLSS